MMGTVKSLSGESVFEYNQDDDNCSSESQEFLIFMLGNEQYGIDIKKVQEIRGYDNVTRVPGTPEFIKGVTNLRGLIVPIVDMRIKFKLDIPSYDLLTVVIILTVKGRLVGMVVSSVSDVISLTPRQIQILPNCESILKPEYLIGLSSIGERVVILIDIERFMTSDEMALMDNTDESL
jgi:purine-binding chemotaxis protein CheW